MKPLNSETLVDPMQRRILPDPTLPVHPAIDIHWEMKSSCRYSPKRCPKGWCFEQRIHQSRRSGKPSPAARISKILPDCAATIVNRTIQLGFLSITENRWNRQSSRRNGV
jgi:hypothetical protein